MCRITVITSLFNCQQYLKGYFEAVNLIENKKDIEILLIHNAPKENELKIIYEFLDKLTCVRHIVVEQREGLYATWNRGIKLARGKYITTWNVDDIRLPHSLIDQANSLDHNDNAALSYGDFKIVEKYGSTEGKSVSEPQFDPKNRTFYRQHHIGCFPMWRKSIHENIGYFDEQFRLIADLDFQIRVARKYSLIKISEQLGYYLEGTPSNLSSNTKLQDSEHTVLHLRYGNFNLIYFTYLIDSFKNFKIFRVKWFGSYHNINRWTLNERLEYLLRFPTIFLAVLKFPRHVARKYFKTYLNILKQRKMKNGISTGAL